MQIDVVRDVFTPKSTGGRLLVNGKPFCYTLEDTVRPKGVKVYGETAIPAGTYEVVITFSQRFQRDMPLLKNVKGFEGIRIHAGNTDKDTHGCLLVGLKRGVDCVLQSRDAYKTLFAKIQQAVGKGEKITLTIG